VYRSRHFLLRRQYRISYQDLMAHAYRPAALRPGSNILALEDVDVDVDYQPIATSHPISNVLAVEEMDVEYKPIACKF
jgi:hypothetical protein